VSVVALIDIAQLIEAWRTGRFNVITSLALLDELADVLSRPRIRRKYQLAPETIAAYLLLISERAAQVDPPGQLGKRKLFNCPVVGTLSP